jgi:hypothetical protein
VVQFFPALSSLRLAEDVRDDLLWKAPAREQPPGARPRRPRARERPARPGGLVGTVARRRDGLGHERLGEPARREVGGDAEAPRPAGAELRGAVVGEPRVVDVAELAAAGDRGSRRRGPVAEADQARFELRPRARRPREEPRSDVERGRRGTPRSGRP